MNYGKEFTKGILKENPTLVGLLGMCPTLAVTTAAFNGIGMGLSTMFVLICSNIVISLLRKVIPEQVKLPCYIVIIASFVTVIQFLVHGFVPALYTSLAEGQLQKPYLHNRSGSLSGMPAHRRRHR